MTGLQGAIRSIQNSRIAGITFRNAPVVNANDVCCVAVGEKVVDNRERHVSVLMFVIRVTWLVTVASPAHPKAVTSGFWVLIYGPFSEIKCKG